MPIATCAPRPRAIVRALLLGSALAAATGAAAAPAAAGHGARPLRSWEPAGFGGSSNYLFLRFDPRQPDLVYLANDVAGLMRSTDGGRSWEIRSTGLGNYELASFALDPFDPATLYAGVGAYKTSVHAGMYISHDAGLGWEHLTATREDTISFRKYRNVESIAPDPTRPGALLVGSREKGIWRSTDWGASWQRVFEAPLSSTPLIQVEATARDDPPIPYPTPFPAVVFDPGAPDTVYAAATGYGVVRSTQGGASGSWQPALDGLPAGAPVTHLAAGPGSALYATVGPIGVFRSTNAGDSWQPASGDLPQPDYQNWLSSVVVDPGDAQTAWLTVFTFGESNLWRTTDGGTHWERLSDPEGANATFDPLNDPTFPWHGSLVNPALHVAVDPFQPNHLLLDTFWTVFRSTDGGGSWEESIIGSQGVCPNNIFIDTDHPAGEPDRLLATFWDAGLLESTNGGSTWTALLPPPGTYEQTLPYAGHYWRYCAAGSGATRYEYTLCSPWGSDSTKVFRRAGGAEWELAYQVENSVGSWTDGVLISIAIDPSRPDTVYVTQDAGLVYRSTDHGTTWSPTGGQPAVPEPPVSYSRALAVDDQGRIFAGSVEDGMWRSTDAGEHWSPVLAGETVVFDVKTAPGAVYATGINDLYRSTNGGDEWQRITQLPEALDPDGSGDEGWAIAVDPRDPDHIVFGRDDASHSVDAGVAGVVETTNGGDTWAAINDGLALRSVTCLAIGGDGSVYAGLTCAGTWRLPPAAPIAVPGATPRVPAGTWLGPSVPNPVAAGGGGRRRPVSIRFGLARDARTRLSLFDVQGREVRRLVDAVRTAGPHRVAFAAGDLPAGVYFYRLRAGRATAVRKLAVIH